MAQYTQRTQPMHRPGQTDHGHGGGTLAYGGKPGGVVPSQQRPPPAAPYAPQAYQPMRLHQPGYGSAALSYRESSYGRSGGAAEYRAGSRMSILGTGYHPPPAPTVHAPPPADPPPFKKIRLTAERPTAQHQPLRVDTREPVSNYNTVEVLSPNPPSEPTVEEQSYRTTKDDLLQQIPKVDREMALLNATLSKLRKKQEELEQSASKPAQAAEEEEAVPRHRSLPQCVYAENRKKATSAHALLAHLGPPVLYPLYNQPQDTEIYHENIRKHRTFRRRLAEHIRRLKLESEKRQDSLADAYTRRAAEWIRRVERIEQGQKRKAKDARNREFFEKVFPELRKQREERERFNRLGARVKSEAELEEIADGLHEQEHEDKKMRALTVVPPLLRDPSDTAPLYTDTNRRCMDMESEHKELQLRNVWSQAEREVFRDKYLQHPKNFGQIASFLPRKSVRDCVRFYYLSKKAENYKQLLRKPRQRRSARNPAARPPAEPELPAGVTTRLQRSQGTVGRVICETGVPSMEGKEGEDDGTGVPVTCIPVPPSAPLHPSRVELIRTPPLPPSPPPASSAPPLSTSPPSMSISIDSPAPPTPPLPPTIETNAVTVTSADVTVTITAITTSAQSILPTLPPSSTPSPSTISTTLFTSLTSVPVPSPPPSSTAVVTPASNSAPPTPQPAQPPTPTQPPTPETAVIERVATPSSTTAASPAATTLATCAVCDAPGATRTVSRSRVSHYGLKEEQVGALVCAGCHARRVLSRTARCAVPRCSAPRVRERRLRHLPPRWHDLPRHLKRAIMDEFQIPSELTKCCLACLKRITRRLDALGGPGEPSEEEVARFRGLLRDHGARWEVMQAHCDKEAVSLKAFYYTYRKKYNLDAIITERSASRDVRTSTEESLSSGASDTASAGDSPRPPPPADPRPRREEYDSSATETADEESETPSTNKVHKAPPPTSIPAPSAISTPTPRPPSPAPLSVPLPPSPAPPPPRNGPSAPQNVREVMLNLIEISLTRDSQPPGIKPHPLKVSSSTSSRNDSLATLSVVSSVHPSAGARSPQRPATITPLQAEPPKEGGVLHISPRHERHERERQEALLDLSVKRRHEPARESPQNHPNKMYRNSEYQFRAQERESPTLYNSKPKAVATPTRPPLKPAATKGSITLGTPVEARFEARRTPEPKAGSITAGTPVHGTHHPPDKRNFDYFKRRSPGGAYYAPPASQPRPQSPSFSPNANPPYSRSPYGMEQQRQIIITDFITSQQMHAGAGGRRAGGSPPAPYYGRREPPVSVIQRHYAPHPQHHPHPHPPPGHEAFTSLVDVASAATALPVPRGETKPEPKPQPHPPHPSPHSQPHAAPHPQHQTSHQQHQTIQQGHQGSHQSSHQQGHPQGHQSGHSQGHQSGHPQGHQSGHQQGHQGGHQQTHPHHHDIRIRDMNTHIQNPSKYHPQPIQYQVLERRAQQVQYLERDRQIQLQQRRETERAISEMQERAHAHSAAVQQLMHDRMHAHNVSNEAERRPPTGATYSVAKHRATPLHVDNRQKDVRPPPVSTASAAPAPAAAPRAEGTLTAASLIDAIITHQISQTSDRFPRECEGPGAGESRAPPSPEHAPPAQHTTSFKLGDLASNIITRDFQSPTTSTLLIHNNRFPATSTDGYPAATSSANSAPAAGSDEWKRRDNPKHAPFLEPVSPPDNHHNNRNAPNRRYGCVGAGGFTTAYDYVTTRIVEVMRSDADERSADRTERAKAIPPFPTQYAFPFNALNVATPPDGAPPTTAPAPTAPAAPPPPEPAPLMSAQYEPLSDED